MDDEPVHDEELTRMNSALSHTRELEDTRKALLFLLEDLEANRQKIEHAKQEWTAVFDAIRDPVMLHDREFRIMRANLAYASAAGSTFEGLIGRRYWELFPKRDGPLPGCQAIAESGYAESSAQASGEEFTLPSGATYLSHAYPVKDRDGAYSFSVHIFEDITERHRARQALKHERDFSAAVVDTAASLVVVIAPDRRIVSFNKACEQCTGYTSEEAIGREFDFLIPPDELAAVDGVWTAIVTAQQPSQFVNDWITKTGDRRLIEWSNTMLMRSDGSVEHVISTGKDITEKALAEAALRDSEEKFRSISAAAQDAIIMINNDGKISYWNDAAQHMLGYTVDEALDREMHSLLAPDHFREQYIEGFRQFQATGNGPIVGKNVELAARRKDGSEFPIELSVGALQFKDSWHAVGIMRDITARKQAERVLEHRLEMERLVTIVSTAFISADLDNLDTTINATLRDIGEITRASRCVVFQFSDDGELLSNTHQWCAPGIESRIQNIRELPARHLPWFMERIREQRACFVANVAALPSEAAAERAHWASHGIKSLLAVTMLDGAALGGFLGIDSIEGELICSDEDIGLLRSVADNLAMTLKRREVQQTLRRVNRALRMLSESNTALVHAADEAALLDEVCRIIVSTGDYRMAWVGFAENDPDKTVRPAACHGHDEGYLAAAAISWADTERGSGPTGMAIRTGTVHVSQDIATHTAMAPWRDAALEHGYAASIALPLRIASGTLGALTLYAAQATTFDPQELTLLQELADDLAFGIVSLRTMTERDRAVVEQQRHFQQLRDSLESTIKAIGSTIEMRDPYTAGHQNRVAQLSVAIARELGLDAESIHGLNLAASIHDLGKIQIPAEILSKPGRLAPIEFELIKAHPKVGYDIVKDVQFPWPIAQMILQHHERLDGSGYPNGLRGDQLLRESKILTVADVVEAMASYRPYRPALGIDAALDEILKHRGTWYDEAAVDACVRLFHERQFSFETHR